MFRIVVLLLGAITFALVAGVLFHMSKSGDYIGSAMVFLLLSIIMVNVGGAKAFTTGMGVMMVQNKYKATIDQINPDASYHFLGQTELAGTPLVAVLLQNGGWTYCVMTDKKLPQGTKEVAVQKTVTAGYEEISLQAVEPD